MLGLITQQKYLQNIIKHDSPKYIQECCVQVACHIETLKASKTDPFRSCKFSCEFNILSEREFGSSKKNYFNPYLPWLQKK